MKHSLRKTFSSRRQKEVHDDDHIYPRIDVNTCSSSNSNLVKPIKSKKFFLRRHHRRSSSSPPPPQPSHSIDKIKSKVFEPRYDFHSNDEDDNDNEQFSSTINNRKRPFNRLTSQIRQSFRNTLNRQRSRLESTNSNKSLILNKNDENHIETPIIYPIASTGLTSPLVNNQTKASLTSTQTNKTISLPIETHSEQHQTIRKHFSFLRKKPLNTQSEENSNKKLTLGQRFNSLRRSFRIGNRNSSSNKFPRSLLSNE